MNTNANAANAARYCASLVDAFEISVRTILAPAVPVTDRITASLKDGGDVMVEFAFLNLPNDIVSFALGDVVYRGEVVSTDAGSEVGQIVTVMPCNSIFAAVSGEVGFDYQSGKRNGLFQGIALLFEGREEAQARADRLAVDGARSSLSQSLRSILAVLLQLPPWDACRLLQETVETIDEPLAKQHLLAIRERINSRSVARASREALGL